MPSTLTTRLHELHSHIEMQIVNARMLAIPGNGRSVGALPFEATDSDQKRLCRLFVFYTRMRACARVVSSLVYFD